jgi:hypothetical protein
MGHIMLLYKAPCSTYAMLCYAAKRKDCVCTTAPRIVGYRASGLKVAALVTCTINK